MTPWETSLSHSACQDSASAACKAPGDCLTGEGPSRAWDLAVELVMRNAKQLTVRAGRVARGLSTWFACEILGSVLRCWEWNQGDGGACMPHYPIPWRPRWQEKLELKVSLATRWFFFLIVWKEGSVGKGRHCHTSWPEFDLQYPRGRRRADSHNYLVASTLHGLCTRMHTHNES